MNKQQRIRKQGGLYKYLDEYPDVLPILKESTVDAMVFQLHPWCLYSKRVLDSYLL
jgi:hypothetical protein